MACALYSPNQWGVASVKFSKLSKCSKLSKWWGEVNGCALVYSLLRCCICQSFTLVMILWHAIEDGYKISGVWLWERQTEGKPKAAAIQFSPVAYLRWSLWRLAIHKFIKIFYRDFWLAWLFWFLTWSFTLWFIILPKVLRSLPTSRRDHFLLLCSRELLIWAKLAAARKSGFWADCSGERGAPCIRIGGMKDNFVSDTFLHFFGQIWHLSHQNTQSKAFSG